MRESPLARQAKDFLLRWTVERPKVIVALCILATVLFAAQIPRIRIDTDPENMLPADEPVRIHHHEVKETFGLHDYVVLGIVRSDSDGVFRPETLERVHRITKRILDLDGVIEDDVLAPSQVDDIYTLDDGTLRVDTLLEEPPASAAEAQRVLVQIRDNPVLRGKLASDDGQALAIFVPVESKDVADEVAKGIEEILREVGGDEEYHLAGIPLAEDRFGAQMFVQMAVAAPAAFALIFLLMLFFFRNVRLVVAPMIVAMMSVTWAMGLLIGMGFTVHIMSSMIPVFLIPIAVLDAIHVLSEFHERLPNAASRNEAIRGTIRELFAPMGFTTLTTIVGFSSLMLTPIPPVQVFGAFVAFGIGAAWFLTMTFLVAWLAMAPEKTLENFGFSEERDFLGNRFLGKLRDFSQNRARPLVVAGAVVFAASVAGLFRIEVNDNPVNWFRADHPLRVADTVMNRHLSGTYLTYLSLDGGEADALKNPAAMRWIERLQRNLEEDPNVGGTTSIVDIVKKVRAELKGDPAEAVVPDSPEEIAQYLFLYEISGGDPEDLFKLVTSDTDQAAVWVQMRKGENRDVARVVALAEEFVAAHPPPGLDARWAGLPYINITWQQKMVAGMGRALGGSFVVVLLMMTLLFRSFRLGLLSMIPLTATITLVYGIIGWIGKPYDMPIAVLSSLSLGLSIDFSIHFLQRAREAFERRGDLGGALEEVFGAPARAIVRNVFVIALGFVPMFFANLMPYVTVAVFFFAIMIISGATTMFSLPALLSLWNPSYLARRGKAPSASIAAGLTIAFLLVSPGAARAQLDDVVEEIDPSVYMRASHLAMYYAAEDGRAVVEMELADKKGKTRTRRFVMIRLDEEEGGRQRYFTYFFEPNDVRRTTFMVWKDPEEDDARWIFVPAVDLVKRISAKDKGSSFVGSDFSYEDVSGRHWMEDDHEFLHAEEVGERRAWVIQSVPKEKDHFSRKLTWVDNESGLPLREEYYDRKDRLERIFVAESIETIDGHPTIVVRSMENVRKEHKTTVTFTDVEYDVGVDESLFTERYLRSPPPDLVRE
jgi:predicted RND superfamily exporter protein/outer membrane lipoprotein-sorting protein